MPGDCVICNNTLAGPICYDCFEGLQQQVLEGARLIALLSRAVLELKQHLEMIELDQTVELPHTFGGRN